LRRTFRFADAYINLTGHHCHTKEYVLSSSLVNIAASRFLRPFSPKLAILDGLRLRRIKRAMLHAAKHKELFHLWWHPHNFGVNLQQNINFLEKILQYYQQLQRDYQFSSITMSGLTDEISKKG
ncbi:MAG TPA: hypothetical protein PKI55_06455, partial [Chitinophagaceae bacterium]|nr:hypothetical protein [Chitinophagaceae bacterium]